MPNGFPLCVRRFCPCRPFRIVSVLVGIIGRFDVLHFGTFQPLREVSTICIRDLPGFQSELFAARLRLATSTWMLRPCLEALRKGANCAAAAAVAAAAAANWNLVFCIFVVPNSDSCMERLDSVDH